MSPFRAIVEKIPFARSFFPLMAGENLGQTPLEEQQSALLSVRLRHIMVPRSDIVSVNHGASLEEVQQLLLQHRFEALPVFQETLDRIRGFIDCHGILKVLREGQEWTAEIKPAFFAASSMSLFEAALEIQKRDTPFILIVDEYGGIDGLVSRDNILNAFVQHWKPLEDPQEVEAVSFQEDGSPVLDGRLSLNELKDVLKTESLGWENEIDDEIETVGGLVCHLAGRVPLKGEIITHPSGIAFEVVDAEPRKIKRLTVRLPQSTQLHKDFHEGDQRAL